MVKSCRAVLLIAVCVACSCQHPDSNITDHAMRLAFVDSENAVYVMPPLSRPSQSDSIHVTESDFRRITEQRAIRKIAMHGAVIDGGGLRHLVHSQHLQELILQNVNISNRDVSIIAQMRNLRILNLIGTQVDDDGLLQLQSLEKLEHLFVSGTGVTVEAAKELQRQLPKIEYIDILND